MSKECEKLEARPRLHRCDGEAVTPGGLTLGWLSRWAVFFPYEVSDGFCAHVGTDPGYVRTL